MAAITSDGMSLRDEQGRQRLFHGINLVNKGGVDHHGVSDFTRGWTPADLDDLAARGINLARLGVIWAATVPELDDQGQGVVDQGYLDWVEHQLDLLHEREISVVLDAHQDLYSQQFGDGAPAWATLTDQPFDAPELWSDAYLEQPAVHEALDAFWTNQPVHGKGLQQHYLDFWLAVYERVGSHPAVIGIDILNEPTPGAFAAEFAGQMLGTFAELTGQSLPEVVADYSVPERKLAQLAHLDRVEVHRHLGDLLAPALAAFEQTVTAFFDRVWAGLREAGFAGLLLREHCYFANTGVPVLEPRPGGDQVVYSPHGYDLVVDTEAVALASNTRAQTIFERARETQLRWQTPVIVGEWGALGLHTGVSDHGSFLLNLFDAWGWSHCYWCWEPGFAATEAAALLVRPRARAIDGTLISQVTDESGWQLTYRAAGRADTLMWLPDAASSYHVQGEAESTREGNLVKVRASAGEVTITVPAAARR